MGMLLVEWVEAEMALKDRRHGLDVGGGLHEGWSRRRNTVDLKGPETEVEELMPMKKGRGFGGDGEKREEGRLGFDVE